MAANWLYHVRSQGSVMSTVQANGENKSFDDFNFCLKEDTCFPVCQGGCVKVG